jgi:hypothetical protein
MPENKKQQVRYAQQHWLVQQLLFRCSMFGWVPGMHVQHSKLQLRLHPEQEAFNRSSYLLQPVVRHCKESQAWQR